MTAGAKVQLPTFEAGWVWLAGAGPGDPGLLTLLAAYALDRADALVYDALVSDEILALVRPDCVLEYAGKRGGKPSPKQPDISRRLIELARQGKRVLRLKGGDPFVFGRGGEEALALVEAGVPFRIIPGISAGIGGLAYAGIPLTHRGTNSAVTFVTAHDYRGQVPDNTDWRQLADGGTLLVVYMPLRNLETLAARLIAAGRPPDQPAALISRATTPDQRVVETTLAGCAEAARREGVATPALLVVGDNVRLRAGLDWLGALSGRVLDPDPLGEARARDAG